MFAFVTPSIKLFGSGYFRPEFKKL